MNMTCKDYIKALNYYEGIFQNQLTAACAFHGELRERLLAEAIKNRNEKLAELKAEAGL